MYDSTFMQLRHMEEPHSWPIKTSAFITQLEYFKFYFIIIPIRHACLIIFMSLFWSLRPTCQALSNLQLFYYSQFLQICLWADLLALFVSYFHNVWYQLFFFIWKRMSGNVCQLFKQTLNILQCLKLYQIFIGGPLKWL